MLRIVSILFLCLPCLAALPPDAPPNFFVSTTGTSGGSGRLASPIDFYTLFTNRTSQLKTNGAIFWLRGGVYSNNSANLLATGIVVRAYPGEVPIIKHGINIYQGCSNITLRGLYLVSGSTERSIADFGLAGGGIYTSGEHTTTIGNYVTGQEWGGIGSWVPASNSVHYGDIYVDNGVDETSSGHKHGHAAYMQNKDGTKVVMLCHFLNSANTTVAFHGTELTWEENMVIASNFLAGSHATGLLSVNYDQTFEVARGDYSSSYGISNVVVSDNIIINDPSDGASGMIVLGEGGVSLSGTNYSVTYQGNISKAGFLNLGNYDSTTIIKSNLIWTDSSSWACRVSTRAPGLIDFPTNGIDWTEWHYNGGNGHPWYAWTNGAADSVGSITTLDLWKSFIHGDSNATYTTDIPTTVITKIWTNGYRDGYDLWWGDVAIWNPNRISNNVPVTLTGLPIGTPIDIRFTGNLLGGSVLTTNYNGTFLIPMTNLNTLQPNDADWPRLTQPTNGASFRIFLTQIGTQKTMGKGSFGKGTL